MKTLQKREERSAAPWCPRGAMFIAVVAGVLLSAPGPVWAVTPETCPVSGCGSNTSMLLSTPILGMNLAGVPNSDGVSLLPALVRATPPPLFVPPDKRCPDGAKLDVQDGAFVGTLGGSVVCSDAAMLGMAFWIEVTCQHKVNPCTKGTQAKALIRISESSQLDTWHVVGATVVPTYRLVWETLELPQGAIDGAREGASICPRREAAMEKWQVVKPSQTSDAWKVATDHVLLVQGEHYRRDAAVEFAGRDWINLACVGGTALAKMRLLGYDPMNPAQSGAERQSTLKMLTARYRGARSYTRPGVPLMWKHRDAREYHGSPEASSWSEALKEATWNGNGAQCVSHRRTWLSGAESRDCAVRYRRVPRAFDCALPEETVEGRVDNTVRLYGYLAAEQQSLQSLRDRRVPPCGHDPSPDAFWTTYPVRHAHRASP